MKTTRLILTVLLALLLAVGAEAQRLQQPLGRGVVVVSRIGTSRTGDGGSGSLVSWRKLAQEPEGTTYNLYRRSAGATDFTKVNTEPLTKTNYAIATPQTGSEYAVTAISPDGTEGSMSVPFKYQKREWDNVWFHFEFDNTVIPRDDYRTKFTWPMDLDGDGEVDAILCDRLYAGAQETDYDSDESAESVAVTYTHKLQAYRLTGEMLWTVDMGPNVDICSGQNDMVVAYDIDCDGRCEVIIKSSDGTRFWDKDNNTWGKYVGGSEDADTDGDGITDYRTQTQRNPPYYISVIDGETGAEKTYSELHYDLVKTPAVSGAPADNYSRDNRAVYMDDNAGTEYAFLTGKFAICYFDGIHPALAIEACVRQKEGKRHYYYMFAWEYDWQDGQAQNWHNSYVWSRNDKKPWPAQAHMLRVADTDGDGIDEMLEGGFGVNTTKGMVYSAGVSHGDRFIVGDIDPDRPGMECFYIQQNALLGQVLYDTRTGEHIKEWYLPSVYDVARGACMDIDPTHKGYEIYSFADDYIYDCKGEKTGFTRSGCGITTTFEGFWWDGDLLREELSSAGGSGWGTQMMVTKVMNRARLIEFSRESGWHAQAGTGTRPSFMGDIIGDWREEVILVDQDGSHSTALTGYSTAMPTDYSIYCLQQDPHYRLDCTTRGYYQHPNTSFYLGADMPLPPLPPVFQADVLNEMANGKSVMFDLQGDNHEPITVNHEPSVLYLMNPRGHDFAFEGAGTTGTGTLIKSMQGTVTFDCDLGHTGQNIVSEGSLIVNGTISGPVKLRARGTLGGNATLAGDVSFEGALNYEGCRLMPKGTESVMTFKKSLTLPGNVFVEIDAGEGKCGKLSVEGDLTLSGQNTITVNLASQESACYVVAECTGTLTCDPAQLLTRGLEGINYDLVAEDRQLVLVVNATRAPAEDVVWTGAESNVWDYKTQNFEMSQQPTAFVAGDQVLFTDDGQQKNITMTEMMVTSGVTFHSGKYVLSGDGGLSGEGGITVNAGADVTLNMKYSDYTGATIVNGGRLTVPNFYDGEQKSAIGASAASEGNLQLNGGTLVLSQDNMATDHRITLTDTATISVARANSALSLKGRVSGTGYLVKDGSGQLNFNYGGANNFAGLIVKKGIVAQGAWNSTFGRSGSPLVLAGGEVHLIDNNSASTKPVYNYPTTVVEGTSNVIEGSSRCSITGSFKGKGALKLISKYVRCDISSDFSQFEGTLTASGTQFRLMTSVTNMQKTHLVVDAASSVGYYQGDSGNEATATLKVGSIAANGTDAVLGGSGSTYEVGYLGEDMTYRGLLKAARIVKVGSGTLTLGTVGSTSPITVREGTLIVGTFSTSSVVTSGTITVADGGILATQGMGMTSTVLLQKGGTLIANPTRSGVTFRIGGQLTTQEGSRIICKLSDTSNDKFRVTGRITHSGDTLIIQIPATRQLAVGDELTIFTDFTQATGTPVVKCVSEDGNDYDFDLSTLNTDGKIRVTNIAAVIHGVYAGGTLADVYTAEGIKVRSRVERGKALDGLPYGLYVVGGRKIMNK